MNTTIHITIISLMIEEVMTVDMKKGVGYRTRKEEKKKMRKIKTCKKQKMERKKRKKRKRETENCRELN